MIGRRLEYLLAGLLLVACSDDGSRRSSGSGSSESSSGGGGAGGGDGASACPDGHACAPAVPAGWTGPAALFLGAAGDTLPACPAAFPALAVDAHAGVAPVAPAECSCSCDAPHGGSCHGLLGIDSCFDATCGACQPASQPVEAGTCIQVIQGNVLWKYVETVQPDTLGADCAPLLDAPTPPPPVWSSIARVCGLDTAATCAGGRCAPEPPAPFGASVCIHQPGDLECPSAYPQKTLLFDGFEDTRACSPCACGAVVNMTCSGTVTAHSGPGCGSSQGSWPVPGCIPFLPTPSTTHLYVSLSPTGGSCNPSGGTPIGEVVALGPTTVCCAD
jgi:hypothetical protein